MSKIDVLTLYPDQTHSFNKRKVEGDIVKIRGHNPKIIPGQSVFPGRKGRLAFFKRTKRLAIWVYGSNCCYTLSEDAGKLDDHWNTSEAEAFINKIIAWAAAKTKLFSNLQVYLLFGGMMAMIVIGILILRRIGI